MNLHKNLWGSLLKAKFQNSTFESSLVDAELYTDFVAYEDTMEDTAVPLPSENASVNYSTNTQTASPVRKVYPPRLIEIINSLKQKCIYQLSLPSSFEKGK